jgi:hypothetical protein
MVTVLVSSRFRHNLEISDHHAESLMTHSHQPGLAKCQKWYRIGEGMRIDSTEFMMSHGKTSSAILPTHDNSAHLPPSAGPAWFAREHRCATRSSSSPPMHSCHRQPLKPSDVVRLTESRGCFCARSMLKNSGPRNHIATLSHIHYLHGPCKANHIALRHHA